MMTSLPPFCHIRCAGDHRADASSRLRRCVKAMPTSDHLTRRTRRLSCGSELMSAVLFLYFVVVAVGCEERDRGLVGNASLWMLQKPVFSENILELCGLNAQILAKKKEKKMKRRRRENKRAGSDRRKQTGGDSVTTAGCHLGQRSLALDHVTHMQPSCSFY